MSNNNVAIISLMAKFDEKSVEQAAKKLGKTTEEALSDIGQDKFGENIVNEFNKAMDTIKKKLKGVNLSSYTNNVLDSLFSKKDIQEKTKDLQNFISNITNLSKSLSGLGNSALNSMSTKQLDSIISKQKKVLEKEEEIAKKRKELESTARNIGNKSRNSSTISKNYLQSDYEQSYKSLEKLFSTEKGFTSEQRKSIKYLSEMLTLYSDMGKIEPEKGTSESIKYASDLLTVVKEINKVSKDIDSFTNGKASKFVNKNFDSTKKVNEYNPKLAQQDFVKAGLSTLNAQKAKLEKDLTEYISKSIEKNLEKITNNAEQSIDKANQKAEKLKNTIDELHSSTGNKPIIAKIVDDSQVKSLEEIEDRLLDLQDKYLEVDKNGYAVNDLDTKELKEFIRLYNQYISMLPKDNKFESDLSDTYKSIIDSDDELKKYADNVQKINKEKQKLAETEVKSNTETNTSKYTEDLKEQQQQIEKTEQTQKDLKETQKATSDTIINVDTAQALSSINAVKESLESLPSEKNIKISVNNTDYSSVPLLSNEEGKTVNMFRGVKNAWSGLVNDKGIGFFTDKLELAVDYADELAKDGKVIQANLSLHNPLEVEGNGARWDQIDFEGVKQKTDDIIEKAKQLGYDGVIFKNIRDGFTDAESDLSNVVAAFDAMSVKNEQVIGTVKAGTGELTRIESTANSMTDAVVESQEKVQLELKETQVQAEETAKAIKETSSVSQESNISSGMKDAFPNADAKPETESMKQVEEATHNAVQAKKDFATANEGVQSSIDGSENPLKLEAELMGQIAKSAREAADAKKEFVEANKQVKDSANGSNNDLVGGHSENAEPSGVKKYKKKGYKAHDTGKHDNEKKVSNKDELGKALKDLQSEIIASIDESTSFVKEVTDFYDLQDNLVKTQMKVGDKNGNMRTYTTSYSMDKDGNATAWTSHIETQKYQDQNKIIQEQIKNLQKLSAEKQKAAESERKSTVNQASKDQLEAWKQIQRIRKEIAGTSNAKLIEQLEQEKKTYQEQYLTSTKILKNNSDLYNSEQRLNELKKISLETTEKINKLQIKNTEKEQTNLNSQFSKMYEGITKYNNQFTEFSKRKTSDSSDDFINNLNAYQIALNQYSTELDRLHNNPDLINEENISNLKKLKNEVDNCSNAFKGLNKGASEISRDKLIVKIADYMDKNTAMTKNFKTQLEGLIAELKSMGANADVSNIADQFFKVQQEIKAAGKEGKKFWDIIAEKAKYGLAAQIGMYFGFNDIVRYAQQAISTIVDLDDALLDLKKTTSMSSTELNNFYYSANDVAKQMGVTTKSIIEQASAWSRLGYSSNEQATEMAKLSSKFASISPGMDTDQAQEGMVSIMKAWQINPEDVEKEILDPINQLGNKFAESNNDIVEGMKRSAAALAAVGTDYKDAYSLFTGVQEVLQNSEVAGRALRSISMRIRGYDENSEDGFEQTDDELKNITGDLIDLTKTAQHAQGVSIFKEGSTTEFKSLVDYFGEIHDIWDEMSQKQQNDFLQKAFGKTQAQAGSALIQNYDAVKEALAEIDESAGSADKEMSTVEQTLSYKINALKETWVGCAQQILDRGDLGIVISGLNGVSKVITGLIDNVGLLKTAAMGVAAAFSLKKNVGILELN